MTTKKIAPKEYWWTGVKPETDRQWKLRVEREAENEWYAKISAAMTMPPAKYKKYIGDQRTVDEQETRW